MSDRSMLYRPMHPAMGERCNECNEPGAFGFGYSTLAVCLEAKRTLHCAAPAAFRNVRQVMGVKVAELQSDARLHDVLVPGRQEASARAQ